MLCLFIMMNITLVKGQKQITPEDFRLCLDDLGCSDSTLKITKKQLLNAKTVTPNFTWFTITQLAFYFSPRFGNDVTVQTCKGNFFCEELKPLIQRSGPGTSLIISAKGVNKKGEEIQWNDIRIELVK